MINLISGGTNYTLADNNWGNIMNRLLIAATVFGLIAVPASGQMPMQPDANAVPVSLSQDCYQFDPLNTRQHFFLGSDANVLFEMVGGGGGGGGNTRVKGGGGGAAGQYLAVKQLPMKAGLYMVRVGSGGSGGRGKNPPAGEPGDDATAGGITQVSEVGGSFRRSVSGGQGGRFNGSPNLAGGAGESVADGDNLIAKGGDGGAQDQHGAPGQAPGAGGGGTGAFRAGGSPIGGTGGAGRLILCVYDRGALTSVLGGRRLQ